MPFDASRLKTNLIRSWKRLIAHPGGKVAVGLLAFVLFAGVTTFAYFYVKFARMVDEKLARGPYTHTSQIYAAPKRLGVGDSATARELAAYLSRCGYSTSDSNPLGWYKIGNGEIEVHPGTDSYFDPEGAKVIFEKGKVARIVSMKDGEEKKSYALEPELITHLFDRNREKRRIVHFSEIPDDMVHAVLSIEDKRFFHHAGFDPARVLKSAWVDIVEGRRAMGASTLTMQLARELWLTRERSWQRKLAESFITMQLELRLSKEEIFEHYANQIYLGRRGSFSIHGFGQASQAFFGKDIEGLTLAEAATIAGIIQRPGPYDPYRYPDQTKSRRNRVLAMMRDNGYITRDEAEEAAKQPIRVVKGGLETTDAPYFVDLVNQELQNQLGDHDFQTSAYRVYTSLDLDLQRAAAEAVQAGMETVLGRLKKQKRFKNVEDPPVQVALVAMDPKTGEVKALIGGRNYGSSQLNRSLALRQPGSVFKPFVYAAALNTVLEGGGPEFYTTSLIVDEPTTFWYNNEAYQPANYGHKTYGEISLRYALTHSVNIATVKLAQQVGYRRIASLAKKAGAGQKISATPAMALGAYEATPIDMAGAYTVFANRGVHAEPFWIKMVRDENGVIVRQFEPKTTTVLDPRVSYLMVSMMQDVVNRGTGAGVRSAGFRAPAAGKTGTSRDGWFAGFTSELICVVWVGFDNNDELLLEGAKSALPIWTEFMKRAHEIREYSDPSYFPVPAGIVSVEVDPATGQLSTPWCTKTANEVFIDGTQPVEVCRLHGGIAPPSTMVAGWESEAPDLKPPPGSVAAAATSVPIQPPIQTDAKPAQVPVAVPGQPQATVEPPQEQAEEPKQRRSVFRRFVEIFQ